ncbi:Wzz/FepE/Etk N-terminal domain-containing protein [Bosea caraganae]|nr:Wzz/FepE/Etk N-terminal domain-containing protein [Bosea caraganae]
MLKANEHFKPMLVTESMQDRGAVSFLDISYVIALLARQKYLIAGSILLFGLCGLAYALLTPPSYRAVSQIIIDPRRLDLFQKDSLFTGAPVDVGTVESQVQLVGSERIASKVIDDLKLLTDPEFTSVQPSSALEVVINYLGYGPSAGDDVRPSRQAVLDSFQKRLDAKRVGLSYIIEVSFTSLDPAKAAKIVNALSDAYIEDIIAGRLGAIQRASSWLETRLEELGQRAVAADQALTAFKADPKNVGAAEMYAKVREMESNVSTYRALYDNFLQRYIQTVQQQSFPTVEARVAAMANPPSDKAAPKTLLILAIMLAAGGAVGTTLAAFRELLDRAVRTGDQLAEATGAPCLGILPALQIREPKRKRWFSSNRIKVEPVERQFKSEGILSVVESARFSRFSETIRSIKIAADLTIPGGRCRIIGISSCLPNEGKSTIAANFAHLIAGGGAKVLLIDTDLRNPKLSMLLTANPQLSLVEVVERPEILSQAVWWNASHPNLHFLPGRTVESEADSFDVLSSKGMHELLAQQATLYDYIVLDFAPLAPVVDVRAALSMVDGMLLVARWGVTTIKILERAVRMSDGLADKLFGVVLNRVDMKKLKQYDDLDSKYYHNSYYLKYRNVKESAAA